MLLVHWPVTVTYQRCWCLLINLGAQYSHTYSDDTDHNRIWTSISRIIYECLNLIFCMYHKIQIRNLLTNEFFLDGGIKNDHLDIGYQCLNRKFKWVYVILCIQYFWPLNTWCNHASLFSNCSWCHSFYNKLLLSCKFTNAKVNSFSLFVVHTSMFLSYIDKLSNVWGHYRIP